MCLSLLPDIMQHTLKKKTVACRRVFREGGRENAPDGHPLLRPADRVRGNVLLTDSFYLKAGSIPFSLCFPFEKRAHINAYS